MHSFLCLKERYRYLLLGLKLLTLSGPPVTLLFLTEVDHQTMHSRPTENPWKYKDDEWSCERVGGRGVLLKKVT
jgi:hypothetical protein